MALIGVGMGRQTQTPDPFKVDPSRKEGLSEAEIEAIRDLYEHFVGNRYEDSSGTEFEVTAAFMDDGEPQVRIVPVDSFGDKRPINKDTIHLVTFKERFF